MSANEAVDLKTRVLATKPLADSYDSYRVRWFFLLLSFAINMTTSGECLRDIVQIISRYLSKHPMHGKDDALQTLTQQADPYSRLSDNAGQVSNA